jgi:hypothetical protein
LLLLLLLLLAFIDMDGPRGVAGGEESVVRVVLLHGTLWLNGVRLGAVEGGEGGREGGREGLARSVLVVL